MRCISGSWMNPRGSPNKASGSTGAPSTTSVSSASRPNAGCARRSVVQSPRLVRFIVLFRNPVGHHGGVPEIDVKVIVGVAGVVTVRPHPPKRQETPRDRGVPADLLLGVERLPADRVDVRGGAPAMRRS